jgi:hypothetical protein
MTGVGSHPPDCVCGHCGRTLTGPLLDVSCRMPDAVFALPEGDRAARVWQSADDRPDFVVLDGEHFFVRGLLPIPLEGGVEFRYGIWLEVAPPDFRRIWDVWDDAPEYARLRFPAWLANALRPWGERTLGAGVVAATRTANDRPYVVAAEDAWLTRALAGGWDTETYEAVVSTYSR